MYFYCSILGRSYLIFFLFVSLKQQKTSTGSLHARTIPVIIILAQIDSQVVCQNLNHAELMASKLCIAQCSHPWP